MEISDAPLVRTKFLPNEAISIIIHVLNGLHLWQSKQLLHIVYYIVIYGMFIYKYIMYNDITIHQYLLRLCKSKSRQLMTLA